MASRGGSASPAADSSGPWTQRGSSAGTLPAPPTPSLETPPPRKNIALERCARSSFPSSNRGDTRGSGGSPWWRGGETTYSLLLPPLRSFSPTLQVARFHHPITHSP